MDNRVVSFSEANWEESTYTDLLLFSIISYWRFILQLFIINPEN